MIPLEWIADGVALLRLQRRLVASWMADEFTVRRGRGTFTVTVSSLRYATDRRVDVRVRFSDAFAVSLAYRMLLGYRIAEDEQ